MSGPARLCLGWSRSVSVLLGLVISMMSPNPPAPWGVIMGQTSQAVVERFQPTGKAQNQSWSRSGTADLEILNFRCPASNGCFSAPSAAQFYFLGGKLSAVTFNFRQEQSPQGVNINVLVNTALSVAGFTDTIASHAAVGRQTRYLHRQGQTLVWVQDGPDIDLKVYLDERAPVGRAEAVAAGAQLDLTQYSGAKAYARAHRAILERRLGDAEVALEAALADIGTSALLKQEARYVLAMLIAADVKGILGQETAVWAKRRTHLAERLKRAAELAPSLAPHLSKLKESLKLERIQ